LLGATVSEGISLIAGLGNPGSDYAATRHNAGVWLLELAARDAGVTLRNESRFNALCGKGNLAGRQLWFMVPQTYMNLSGDAVAALARFYKVPVEEILVLHDELDLLPGTVRLKQGGGAGGHNGLTDIIQKLGSNAFARLRIGIGHPGSSSQVSSYVLKRAPEAEQTQIDAAIELARQQLGDIVHGRFQQVMNVLHTHSK